MFGLYGTFLQYQLGIAFLGVYTLTGLPTLTSGDDDENTASTPRYDSDADVRNCAVRTLSAASRPCFHAAVDYFESLA